MNMYIIYSGMAQVGTTFADYDDQAVTNFKEENMYYKEWNLSAFRVNVP